MADPWYACMITDGFDIYGQFDCRFLIESRLILIFWPTAAIKGSHDGKIKASCARGATIWISQTFSASEKLRYLPYTSTYANTVISLTYVAAVEDRNHDITLIINYEIKSVLNQSGICYYEPPFHQPSCIPSSHPNLARPILKMSIYLHLMIKIPVYEFPPVINIATIQDIECQTGNRFRESPE